VVAVRISEGCDELVKKSAREVDEVVGRVKAKGMFFRLSCAELS